MSSELIDRIQRHRPSLIGLEYCHTSAVLIPLIESPQGPQIVLEQRAAHLTHQPGDICLPGGGMEAGETPRETAVREACEELLISPEQIEVLAMTDVLHTDTLIIYPYAARLSDYHMTCSADEVARVFTVPLSFFGSAKPEEYVVTLPVHPPADFPLSRVYGGAHYRWRERREHIYFYQYGDLTIWGITAKILHAFAEIALPPEKRSSEADHPAQTKETNEREPNRTGSLYWRDV